MQLGLPTLHAEHGRRLVRAFICYCLVKWDRNHCICPKPCWEFNIGILCVLGVRLASHQSGSLWQDAELERWPLPMRKGYFFLDSLEGLRHWLLEYVSTVSCPA